MNNLTILLLPIFTGISATLWSKMCELNNPLYSVTSSTISYLIVMGILFKCGYGDTFNFSKIPLGTLCISIVVSTIVTLLWIYPLRNGASFISVTLAEISYPFFALLFSFLVFGNEKLNLFHYAGSAIVVLGISLLLYGNNIRDQIAN